MVICFSTLFDFYISKSIIRDFKNPFVLLFFYTFSAIFCCFGLVSVEGLLVEADYGLYN